MEFHFHVHLGENTSENREQHSQQLPSRQSFSQQLPSQQSFSQQSPLQQPFRTSPNIWFSESNQTTPNRQREHFERFLNSINPLLNQFSNTRSSNPFSTSSNSSASSTAQPSTASSTAQPSTASSTAQPSTASSTAQPSTASSTAQPSTTVPDSNPQIIFQGIQDLMSNMTNVNNVNNTNPSLTSIIRNFTDMNNNSSVPNNSSNPSNVRNEQTFTTSNISPIASNLLQMFTNPLQSENFQVSVALQSTETELPIRRRNRGMSIHELNQHSHVFVNTNNDQLCSICHDTIQQQSICRRLNRCQHVFHQLCIDQWLNNNQTCPLCMQNVTHREHSTSTSTTEGSPQNNISQNNNSQPNDIDLEQIMEEASEELDNDLESDNSEEDVQADGLTSLPI
jgi:hypothetical protein